jgi:hypothetical protein
MEEIMGNIMGNIIRAIRDDGFQFIQGVHQTIPERGLEVYEEIP